MAPIKIETEDEDFVSSGEGKVKRKHYYVNLENIDEIVALGYDYLDDNGSSFNIRVDFFKKTVIGKTMDYSKVELSITESEIEEILKTVKKCGRLEISPSNTSIVTDNNSLWILETIDQVITIDELLNDERKLCELHECYFGLINKKMKELGIKSFKEKLNDIFKEPKGKKDTDW